MSQSKQPQQEAVHLPCDHRYRTNQYFLADQLKCSEAVADFKSVKSLLQNTSAFNALGSFRFQTATVPVKP